MKVWHLAFRPDSLSYTIAKAVSFGGHEVIVLVADPEHRQKPPTYAQTRLPRIPRIRIVSVDECAFPSAIDRLIVQVYPRPGETLRAADRVAGLARRISLVTAGDRSQAWRDALKAQWMERRALGTHFAKVDRVLYKDGFHACDLHGLFKARRAIGFDVHSKFLDDDDAFDAIHARDWRPEERRAILANFLGSRDPDVRRRILDAARPAIESAGTGAPATGAGKPLYWHEYSDEAPAALEPREFLDVLSRSDFTLCPRGYSIVTHRPIEALLRGSIPVLGADELDLYGIPLVDGENCIAVKHRDWPRAIESLGRIGEEQIVVMRRHVYATRSRFLDYDRVAKDIRERLGVQE